MKKSAFISTVMTGIKVHVHRGVIDCVTDSNGNSAMNDIVKNALSYSKAVDYGVSLKKEPYKGVCEWIGMTGQPATKAMLTVTYTKLRGELAAIWSEMTFPEVVPDGVYELDEFED